MSLLERIGAGTAAHLHDASEQRTGVLIEVRSAHPTAEQVVDALFAKLGLGEAERAALQRANGGVDIRQQLIAELQREGVNAAALTYVGGGRYRGYVGLPKQMQQRLAQWAGSDGQAPAERPVETNARQQELQAQGALARHRAELALRTQEARQQLVTDVLGTGGAQMAGVALSREVPKAAPHIAEALPPLLVGAGMVMGVAATLDKGLELSVERQMELVRDTAPMMSEKQDEPPAVDTAQPQPSAPALPTDDELPKGELVPADEAPPAATSAPQGKPSGAQPGAPQEGPPRFNPLRDIPPLIAGTVTGMAAEETMRPRGRLEVEPGRRLTPEEQEIAEFLVTEDRHVLAKADSREQHVKNPDFEVDGVVTELKTVSNITGKDMGGSLARRILEAKSQAATHAIINVRGQVGMTREIAENAIKRAYVVQTMSGRVRLYEVRIIGKDFDVTVPYDPTR